MEDQMIRLSKDRGALIVLEGCDRAGKSTQAKMLMQALNRLKYPAKLESFPNRKTPIGAILNSFLSKTINMPPEAAHLLFSANRWECKADIEETLIHDGVTMVVDRYVASGAVYTAANSKKSLSWCQQADVGLPKPDCVLFLKVSKQEQEKRKDFGKERYEDVKFQKRVRANYKQLKDDTWITINADQDKETVHTEILQKVVPIIERVQDRNIQFILPTN